MWTLGAFVEWLDAVSAVVRNNVKLPKRYIYACPGYCCCLNVRNEMIQYICSWIQGLKRTRYSITCYHSEISRLNGGLGTGKDTLGPADSKSGYTASEFKARWCPRDEDDRFVSREPKSEDAWCSCERRFSSDMCHDGNDTSSGVNPVYPELSGIRFEACSRRLRDFLDKWRWIHFRASFRITRMRFACRIDQSGDNTNRKAAS